MMHDTEMTSHENTLMDVGSAMSSVTLLKHALGHGSTAVHQHSGHAAAHGSSSQPSQ